MQSTKHFRYTTVYRSNRADHVHGIIYKSLYIFYVWTKHFRKKKNYQLENTHIRANKSKSSNEKKENMVSRGRCARVRSNGLTHTEIRPVPSVVYGNRIIHEETIRGACQTSRLIYRNERTRRRTVNIVFVETDDRMNVFYESTVNRTFCVLIYFKIM